MKTTLLVLAALSAVLFSFFYWQVQVFSSSKTVPMIDSIAGRLDLRWERGDYRFNPWRGAALEHFTFDSFASVFPGVHVEGTRLVLRHDRWSLLARQRLLADVATLDGARIAVSFHRARQRESRAPEPRRLSDQPQPVPIGIRIDVLRIADVDLALDLAPDKRVEVLGLSGEVHQPLRSPFIGSVVKGLYTSGQVQARALRGRGFAVNDIVGAFTWADGHLMFDALRLRCGARQWTLAVDVDFMVTPPQYALAPGPHGEPVDLVQLERCW